MSQHILYMMLGYPGAGKTTTAKIISDVTSAKYLSSDDLRQELFQEYDFSQSEHDQLYRELDAQLEEIMKNGGSVVYDANLNRYIHRQEKYDLAAKYNYQTVLVWVKAPRDLAKERRRSETDNHNLVPAHETPESMFDRIAGLFEPPKDTEKYVIIDGTNVTKETVSEALESTHN